VKPGAQADPRRSCVTTALDEKRRFAWKAAVSTASGSDR
jgi:hypothetical protein